MVFNASAELRGILEICLVVFVISNNPYVEFNLNDNDSRQTDTYVEETGSEDKENTQMKRNPSEKEPWKVSENLTSSFSTLERPTIKDILSRMSKIIDKLAEQTHFKKVNKANLMNRLSALVEKYPEDVLSLTDDELSQRIKKIMVIELVAGMLQELTPEEMKSFDEAVQMNLL